MKKSKLNIYFLATAFLILCLGCKVQLVAPYDPELEKGIIEFKEHVNLFLKNMENKGGSTAGQYQSNVDEYAELETEIELLVDRALIKSTGACKLGTKESKRLNQMLNSQLSKLSNLLSSSELAPLNNLKTQINAETTGDDSGNSYGCSARLLQLVKDQLQLIKDLHRVKSCGTPLVSCLNKDEVKAAELLINMSINSVWVVEESKKN